MNQIRFLFLVLVLAVVAVPTLAQVYNLPSDSSYLEQFRGKTPDQIVGKVWLDICDMNKKQYPDSNLVMPGDVIFTPLGTSYTAQSSSGKSHMWDASVRFANRVVKPYLSKGTIYKATLTSKNENQG